MITKNDVIHFYKKYKENLKKEERITADLMQAENQEKWVEKLKQKYRIMRQLYIENEAMLNLCVRPFIEGRVKLTQELAETFVDQIRIAWQEGFEDNLAMMEMAEALIPYFREHGPMEYYIWDLNLLGIFYNGSSETEEGRKGFEYFRESAQFVDRYFEISDFEVRKRLIYTFYNKPILQVNFLLAESEELCRELDEAQAFYRDPRVLELDGDRFDFEGCLEELNYDVFGNYVLSHNRENSDRKFLERGEKVLSVYYQKELEKDPNPYAMLDEIYCYYKRVLFFLGKISCTEFLDDYKKFCDYTIAHDTLEHPDGFWDSRLFQVAVNHLPGILECLNRYGEEYHGDPELRSKCVEAYLNIIKRLPRTGNSRFVNDVITRSLYGFMELLTVGDVDSDILINVMINRDEITLIHSRMVSQIATLLVHAVLEKRPELLIGALDTKNLVDVLEKREQITAFVSQASKLFDFGKLKDADIVNKQSRQLTATELRRIHMHPVAGANIVKRIPALAQFHDVVLGHHKSWDGTMGYPKSFDNTKSKDRFLIELIHVSDCLDAATDFISRSYKGRKSLQECLEELREGKGTIYSPELIGLIEENAGLQEELKALLKEGRIHTYYEVYGIALAEEQNEDERLNVKDTISQKFGQEVTEDERLLDMLHESGRENHEFVQAMVRQSLLALYVELRSGRYHVFSRGEKRLFDVIPDGKYQDFLMKHLKSVVLPQDWAKMSYQLRLSELIHALSNQNGTYECEMRVLLNGEYRWAQFRFVKMDEENVIPRTMALVVTDVQERHNRSDQMEAALKDAYQTAREASRTKSIFLSNMSHDIRTPMNGIIGMTQIALQHLDQAERVKDCLQKIDASSRHLMELINEVLDMSRIESGKTILHMEPVPLQELLRGVVDVCRPGIIDASQELQVDISALGEDCVMADAVRLRQIFTNILSNAVKYTPEKGRISVRAGKLSENEEAGNCYRFEIEDNGIGMSEEFQQKIFEPFSREDNSMTNVTQGTGLGLAIVKSMITMMGGSIDIDSTQGAGTRVSVTLQLLQVEKQEEDEERKTDNHSFDGQRILLVEDNEINREIASELLTDRGLQVEIAVNGKEAYDMFEKSEAGYYQLILMDIQMPVLNGYDATRAIRNISGKYAEKIPIVALTANVFQDDISRAMESGMNDYITKPIHMKNVSTVLSKWM